MAHAGGRPRRSSYIDALLTLGGRASLVDIRHRLAAMGHSPTPESAYQRMLDLRQQGRVNYADGVYSIPPPGDDTPGTSKDDRMDALLARLVRAGILPIDHGI